MFIREGQGVYQFGSKRVFVKIDQEKIYSIYFKNYGLTFFIVRIGGGFISIEEFLQIYTPLELEKLIRNGKI